MMDIVGNIEDNFWNFFLEYFFIWNKTCIFVM